MSSQVQKVHSDAATQADAANVAHSYVRPPVDIAENESGFTLLADIPGVSKDNLAIRVDGDTLLIEAVLSAPSPENMDVVYEEARFSAYRRQFALSRELDTSRI